MGGDLFLAGRRDVRNGDSPLSRGFDVNVVDTDAVPRDDPDVRECGEYPLRDFDVLHEQRVGALTQFD